MAEVDITAVTLARLRERVASASEPGEGPHPPTAARRASPSPASGRGAFDAALPPLSAE